MKLTIKIPKGWELYNKTEWMFNSPVWTDIAPKQKVIYIRRIQSKKKGRK